jgi:hypothetical protein
MKNALSTRTRACVVCGTEFRLRFGRPHQNVCSRKCARRVQFPARPALLKIETGTYLIELTKGYFAEVDECDVDIANVNWAARINTSGTVYAYRSSHDGPHDSFMHREIFSRVVGRPLGPSELVDHINRDGRDNRRENLRLASHSQNSANSRTPISSKSGYKGVSWHKASQKWGASIAHQGKSIWLGLFACPQKAHEAYCEAARELFGEFARFE